MKRNSLIFLICGLFPILGFAAKDPYIENYKGNFEVTLGKSKLFEVKSGEYNKKPSTMDGMNVYTMILKVKKRLGKGIFTFVKYPEPASQGQKKEDMIPEYQSLTLEVHKYTNKTVSMEKVHRIPLHLDEAQTVAVYQGQKLIITWYGDGGWGQKGFHFYSYLEKLK